MAERLINYTVFACEKNAELHDAQRRTCLRHAPARTMGDLSERDRILGLTSTTVKLIRALLTPQPQPWTMFIDDDCWVNVAAAESTCSKLDPREPIVMAQLCSYKIKGTWRDLRPTLVKVFDEPHAAKCDAELTSFLTLPENFMSAIMYGGSGIVMSKRAIELVNAELRSDSAVAKLASTLLRDPFSAKMHVTHDEMLTLLVNRVPVVHRHVASMPATSTQPGWNCIDNRVGNPPKMVCDLNGWFPRDKNNEFDPALAVELQTKKSTVKSGQCLFAGEQQLITWHKFKSPRMFEQMADCVKEL